MTQLMVSVQNSAEFRLVCSLGVQWIDMKDPSRGALQPTDPRLWQEASTVDGHRLSLALGELSEGDWPGLDLIPSAIDFVKIGLAHTMASNTWSRTWLAWAEQVSRQATPVIVCYADHETCGAPSPEDLFKLANEAPFGAFLIDTYDKSRGGLFDLCSETAIKELIESARSFGLTSVLGGSLRLSNLSQALACRPDVVAVRSAACSRGRQSSISQSRVVELLSGVQRLNSSTVQPRPQADFSS